MTISVDQLAAVGLKQGTDSTMMQKIYGLCVVVDPTDGGEVEATNLQDVEHKLMIHVIELAIAREREKAEQNNPPPTEEQEVSLPLKPLPIRNISELLPLGDAREAYAVKDWSVAEALIKQMEAVAGLYEIDISLMQPWQENNIPDKVDDQPALPF